MQEHSIYEILSMTRAGSMMRTVHYSIKIILQQITIKWR